MEKIKGTDLIVGNIYKYPDSYIFRWHGDNIQAPLITTNGSYFSHNFRDTNNYTIATLKEQQHFIACEKAKRFIPLDQIKINQGWAW